jgi:hypothetical protein
VGKADDLLDAAAQIGASHDFRLGVILMEPGILS